MRARMFHQVVALTTIVAFNYPVEALKIQESSHQENAFGLDHLNETESSGGSSYLGQVSAEDGLHYIALLGGLWYGYHWGEKDAKEQAQVEITKKEDELRETR